MGKFYLNLSVVFFFFKLHRICINFSYNSNTLRHINHTSVIRYTLYIRTTLQGIKCKLIMKTTFSFKFSNDPICGKYCFHSWKARERSYCKMFENYSIHVKALTLQCFLQIFKKYFTYCVAFPRHKSV